MGIPQGYVYLDWAATTPLCEEAAAAMAPYLAAGPGNFRTNANANSLHTPGRAAFSALEDARVRVARALGAARPTEVVFTSGATEADNMALRGIVKARIHAERQAGNKDYRPHVITTAIEHDAVLSLLPELRAHGCETTILDPDRQGFVSVGKLEAALRPETALVSVMAVNNEVGTVQDIAALAACAHASGVPFHTDATQALGKVPVDLRAWGVDAASFSAHKVCGPKGVGALFLKTGVHCAPFIVGGGQESGKRSGTQNVMGAAGFAAAAQAAVQMLPQEQPRLRDLRDALYERLSAIPGVRATVGCERGSDRFAPNIVHVLVPGLESETLILRLDLAGFAVSGGSACSTGSLEPSHVLTALGVPRDDALCSLRVSMGRYTTREEIDGFAEALEAIVRR